MIRYNLHPEHTKFNLHVLTWREHMAAQKRLSRFLSLSN